MNNKSKPLDDITNLMTNAVGAIKGVGDEARAMGRAQMERVIADMDLITRDEFEVLQARYEASLEQIAALEKAVKALTVKAKK